MRGGGAPLDPTTRAFMEPRFGHDFSQVRVHTDARAATVARSLDALAFTVGDDIAFAPGQYRPGSDEGRALLAHELTHTLQQTGGAARVQRQENVNTGIPSTGNGSSPGSGRRMIQLWQPGEGRHRCTAVAQPAWRCAAAGGRRHLRTENAPGDD